MATETPDQAPLAELEYEPSAFEQALAKHKNKLITLAVLGGLAVAGYYTLNIWKEHSNHKNGLAFFKAQTLEDYRRVAKDLAGKNAGGNAALMVAQTLSDEGKPEEAITELNSFISNYPDHPLLDLATVRLADAQLLSGKVEDAKATFEKVHGQFPKSSYAPLALLRLGDLYASEKNEEKARGYYEQLKVKYPGAEPYFATAMEHRDALTLKEPTSIPFVEETPPPPPAATGIPGLPNPTTPSTELTAPSLSLDGNAPASTSLTPGAEPAKVEITPPVPVPGTPPPAAPVEGAAPAPAAPAAPTPAAPAPVEAPKVETPAAPAAPTPAAPTKPE